MQTSVWVTDILVALMLHTGVMFSWILIVSELVK